MQRILIVEDHELTAQVLKRSLKHAGFDVAVAFNGREAMTHLAEGAFDLVILDYILPDMDGRELCLRLRACNSWAWATLPVILVSAKILELDVSTLRKELGLIEVFEKPFSPHALIRVIEKYFADVPSGLGK